MVGIVTYSDSLLARNLAQVKTQFVRDRIRETPWNARAYIGDLLHIEQMITNGGPHGFAGHVVWHYMNIAYGVEIEAIRQELTTGVLTSSDEFHRRVHEHDVEKNHSQRIVAERAAEEQARNLDDAKTAWERAGGARD